MTNVVVIHKTDVGATLDTSTGKLEVASSQATDAEVAAAIAAADVAEDAQLAAAIQASETADAIEEQKLLENVRLQEGLFHNTMWELQDHNVKAHTVDGSSARLLSVSSAGYEIYAAFYFPAAGTSVPSLSGGSPIVVDSLGFITLPDWGVLWYKYAGTGQGWYWSSYTNMDINPSMEYIRVLALNHDSGSITAQLSDGRTIVQGKNYPDTSWTDLAPYFAAGITNYGQGHQTGRAKRSGNRVYLEGLLLVNTSYIGNLFTLPDGMRPKLHQIFSGNIYDGVSRVDVSPTGDVSIVNHPSAHPWVSLAGINFGLD